MFYQKNLPLWEQVLRFTGGSALVAYGLGGLLGYALAASGAIAVVTGLFGYCPACAMVWRRPRDQTSSWDVGMTMAAETATRVAAACFCADIWRDR